MTKGRMKLRNRFKRDKFVLEEYLKQQTFGYLEQ